MRWDGPLSPVGGRLWLGTYLWYPALKRPCWEGPGRDSDILKDRVRGGNDWI